MCPVRYRTKPCHALAVGVYVAAFAGVISIGATSTEQYHVQFVSQEVFTLRLVLNDREPMPGD